MVINESKTMCMAINGNAADREVIVVGGNEVLAIQHCRILYLICTGSKYLSKRKGRFYCLFVDFSKAFDSIPHNLL